MLILKIHAVQAGANLELREKFGATALILALGEYIDEVLQQQMVALLIKEGADVENPSCSMRTPLIVAAHNGRVAACELLLQNKADMNAQDDLGLR